MSATSATLAPTVARRHPSKALCRPWWPDGARGEGAGVDGAGGGGVAGDGRAVGAFVGGVGVGAGVGSEVGVAGGRIGPGTTTCMEERNRLKFLLPYGELASNWKLTV